LSRRFTFYSKSTCDQRRKKPSLYVVPPVWERRMIATRRWTGAASKMRFSSSSGRILRVGLSRSFVGVFDLGCRVLSDVLSLHRKVQRALQTFQFSIDRRSFHGLSESVLRWLLSAFIAVGFGMAYRDVFQLSVTEERFQIAQYERWPRIVFSVSPAKCERSNPSHNFPNRIPLPAQGILKSPSASSPSLCFQILLAISLLVVFVDSKHRSSFMVYVIHQTPRYSAAAECSSHESRTSSAAFRDGGGGYGFLR
jgi:hypothetical protein